MVKTDVFFKQCSIYHSSIYHQFILCQSVPVCNNMPAMSNNFTRKQNTCSCKESIPGIYIYIVCLYMKNNNKHTYKTKFQHVFKR
jgi:hypothetical protein